VPTERPPGTVQNTSNSFLADRQCNSERITRPLVRAHDGSWRGIGWDEALDLAARKLAEARVRHGSQSVLFHRGNGSFAALKCMINENFVRLEKV
jgi:anaerobic selenocysteine-containing dehydrogenase